MPHVIVKMHPGRSDDKKEEIAKKISRSISEVFECSEKVVSLAFEEIKPEDWKEEVYDPFIADKEETVWQMPGYKM